MAATHTLLKRLNGDPENPESAEYSIEFPGGSISVCRTSDNKYWAHVYVNDQDVSSDIGTVFSRKGKLVKMRESENHYAVLVDIEGGNL